MCLPTIITTAVAAVAAVALATPPAGDVAAPAVSSLVQLSGVAGRLPQVATTSSIGVTRQARRRNTRSGRALHAGTGSHRARDLGDLVDQVDELIDHGGRGGGVHLNSIIDAGGRPSVAEMTGGCDPSAVQYDAECVCLPIEIVQDAGRDGQMQQVGAGEIGGDVHATISPAVREVRHRGVLGGAQAACRALDGEVSHERQTATARRPSQWRSAGPCVASDAI